MTLQFSAIGYGGKRYSGKGKLIEILPSDTRIVRLITNDYLGFGTYLKGQEIRISPYEIS